MHSNENLAALVREVAVLEAQKVDPRRPRPYRDSEHAPATLFGADGVPIVLDNQVVDFAHLVERAKVVHPEPLACSTLQAVADYFTGPATSGSFIQVASPTKVRVYENGIHADGRRHKPLVAVFSAGPRDLFGQWLPVEDFTTWLLLAFADDAAVPEDDQPAASDLGALLWSLKQGVTCEDIRAAADGGGGVELKTSRGVAITWHDGIGPRFSLSFACTFPEIDQPKRVCVFRGRGRKGEGDGVQVKLEDADGGKWAAVAQSSIAAWLREKVGDDVMILG